MHALDTSRRLTPNKTKTPNFGFIIAHPHVSGVGSRRVARSGSAALGYTSEREAPRVVPGGALSSALVQAFFLLFFADLDLGLAAASAGLISPNTCLEQFRALRHQGIQKFMGEGREGEGRQVNQRGV